MSQPNTARKFTDRNLARSIADKYMRENPGTTCKIINVENSKMFLYIAVFDARGKKIATLYPSISKE